MLKFILIGVFTLFSSSLLADEWNLGQRPGSSQPVEKKNLCKCLCAGEVWSPAESSYVWKNLYEYKQKFSLYWTILVANEKACENQAGANYMGTDLSHPARLQRGCQLYNCAWEPFRRD
jgi:hypothetical protein